MSRQAEEERLVGDISAMMLGKLRANRHKPHWRSEVAGENRKTRLRFFLYLLKEEVKELEEAIDHDLKPAHLRLECADVACFAAEIADIASDESPDAP